MDLFMDKLAILFTNLLGVEPEQLREESKPGDFVRWDSLGHLQLMSCIEEEFGIELTPEQVEEMVSYGQIRRVLREVGVSL